MAIPLRVLTSSDDRPRFSMDSEAEAILAYALGKERRDSIASNTSGDDDDDDEDEDDLEVHTTPLSGDDEEAFLKENDPLTLDFKPRPFKRVKPSSPSFPWGLTCWEKSRRFFLCVWIFIGLLLVFWGGALIGYLSKGYFRPHRAPPSPIAAARRITIDQVTLPFSRGLMGSFWMQSCHQSIRNWSGQSRWMARMGPFYYGMRGPGSK
jgi:hypothetical protein